MFDVGNLAGAVSDSSGSGSKKALQQYEPCNIKGCKYLNEEGFCSKETCVILNEHPQTAKMVTKICMFCGTKFTTNLDSMQIQLCPQCLEESLAATRRGGDDTNATSGTVDVIDKKLKEKFGDAKTKGFDASMFGDLFGSGSLEGLSSLSDIEMSNIQGDLNNLSGKDLSSDLGSNLSMESASDILGQGGGHSCMFCGKQINQNPSLFFPCCPKCFTNLVIVTTQCSAKILTALAGCSASHLSLAGNSSHCYACDDW